MEVSGQLDDLASIWRSVQSVLSQLFSLNSETPYLAVPSTRIVVGSSPNKINVIDGAVNAGFLVEKGSSVTSFSSCTSALYCQISFPQASYPGRRGYITGPAVLQTA